MYSFQRARIQTLASTKLVTSVSEGTGTPVTVDMSCIWLRCLVDTALCPSHVCRCSPQCCSAGPSPVSPCSCCSRRFWFCSAAGSDSNVGSNLDALKACAADCGGGSHGWRTRDDFRISRREQGVGPRTQDSGVTCSTQGGAYRGRLGRRREVHGHVRIGPRLIQQQLVEGTLKREAHYFRVNSRVLKEFTAGILISCVPPRRRAW